MKKKLTPAKRTRCPTPTTEVVVLPKATLPSKALVKSFAEVIGLIQQARQRAFQTVNTALKWSSRELERQLAGALFERTVLSPPNQVALRSQSFNFHHSGDTWPSYLGPDPIVAKVRDGRNNLVLTQEDGRVLKRHGGLDLRRGIGRAVGGQAELLELGVGSHRAGPLLLEGADDDGAADDAHGADAVGGQRRRATRGPDLFQPLKAMRGRPDGATYFCLKPRRQG